MCDWVTMLYSRKLTEHCKPAITEKKKKKIITLIYIHIHQASKNFKQFKASITGKRGKNYPVITIFCVSTFRLLYIRGCKLKCFQGSGFNIHKLRGHPKRGGHHLV